MEIRVLTLFDDEDFFSPEEAPKKTKKTAAAKEKADENGQEAIAQSSPAAATTPAAETATGQTEQENTSIPEADTTPEITAALTPERDMEEQEVIPEAEPLSFPPPLQAEEPVTEEDLGKQMLQELIQQDYAALIHKDYPFDVQQASVVKKDKEIKVKPVVVEENDVEEEEVFEEVPPLPEWNLDKKYYTIGEVAQLFSVNTSHIRFWTNEFKLKPRTTRKGDRLYSPRDIAELRLIHHLVKEKKHTIKGAREKLKVEKTGVNQKLDLKESLSGLRDMLVQIKEQL